MVVALVLLFTACMALSFVEDRLSERDKKVLYVILGFVMIMIAGTREVGSTPDTISYEEMYYAKEGDLMVLLREPTFGFFVDTLQSFGLGINALFFTYAILSIPIHLSAFRRMSRLPLLTLTIYLSYYYMMHDMVQIRCGVASGLFLWAIYFYVERKRLWTLAFILIGTLFHYSAIAGLVIFLCNDQLPRWQRYVLYSIVPIGIVAYFTHFDITSFIPNELGGYKLMKYCELSERGDEEKQAGWKFQINILIWMNIVLYYASIYYHDYLKQHFKYTTVAIKLQAVGFLFLFFVNALSAVVGNRMNDYFSVASVLLWTGAYYAFYPQLLSRVISNVISSIRFVTSMLGYALSLLWM